jgi:hypothetical protein
VASALRHGSAAISRSRGVIQAVGSTRRLLSLPTTVRVHRQLD